MAVIPIHATEKRRGIELRDIHIDDWQIDTIKFKAHDFDRGLLTSGAEPDLTICRIRRGTYEVASRSFERGSR